MIPLKSRAIDPDRLDTPAVNPSNHGMANTSPQAELIAGKQPCVSVETEDVRLALHPPTQFMLQLADDYRLLLPFGAAAIDIALGEAGMRRLRARPGDIVMVEPGTVLTARHVEPLEFLIITIKPTRFRRTAEAAAGPLWRTRNLQPWHEPAAAALGAEMRRVLLTEGLPSAPYLVTLADALVTRIVVALASESHRVSRDALAPARLARVLRYIEEHLAEPISTSDLAAIAGLSTAHFARAFARETGDPPHRFVTKRRVCRARDLLSSNDGSIAEIAARTGFSSQAHLSTVFRKEVGISPARYRAAFRLDETDSVEAVEPGKAGGWI